MASSYRVLLIAAAVALTGAALRAVPVASQGTAQQQQTQQQGRGQAQGRGGQQGQAQSGRQGGQQGQQGGRQAGAPRDNAQAAQQTGTGGIAGTIVLADSSRPVRRARVTLTGGDVRVTKTAVSDDQGNFAFTDLPGGRYTLTASKPGYVNATYGQKKPGRPEIGRAHV